MLPSPFTVTVLFIVELEVDVVIVFVVEGVDEAVVFLGLGFRLGFFLPLAKMSFTILCLIP